MKFLLQVCKNESECECPESECPFRDLREDSAVLPDTRSTYSAVPDLALQQQSRKKLTQNG